MEVALTFGSVGDIIQLCQLAIQLKRAIGAGCNSVGESAIEYQELRDELDTLVRILMQVRDSAVTLDPFVWLTQCIGRGDLRAVRILCLSGWAGRCREKRR